MKITYYLYRLAGLIVPRIPATVGYALCRLFGGILYKLNSQARRNIQQNVERILGPETPGTEIEQRTRAAFNYILYNYFDLFRLPALDEATVERLVTINGWENVTEALSGGRGTVMVSVHFGNIEVVLYAMLLRGVSITIPVERVEPPELFDYISRVRMSKGLKLVPIDGPLLSLMRDLRKGGIVGLAGDRDITETGQIVEFFGHPARLPDGHVKLALKTGVPLVIGFSHRTDDQTYEAHYRPPFYLPATGSDDERIAAGMRYLINEMEQAIRQYPEQWTITVSIWADNQ
ncbi:MAG: hypothetical protein R3264_09995 [Anaerolineae bacterium]|nr:hypothetical protein [Anaerolineae bacterium]